MRKHFALSLISFVSLILISWGVVGHKTVATIAENHLTPKAKAAVKALLGDTTMADVASWADEIRTKSQYKFTTPRHYVDLPLGLSYKVFIDTITNQPADNVYKAVIQCEKDLSSKSTSNEQKAVALKYLIHFVGDLHQPMHVSRAEDQGGNTIQLQYNGKGTNLHSLWDSKLIGTEGKSFEQMSVDYDTATAKQIRQWQSEPLSKWLWESYQITTKLYAEAAQNNKLDDNYYKSHINIIHERIEMGGIRLAGILNRIFESSTYNNLRPTTEKAPETTSRPKQVSLEYAASHVGQTVYVIGKVADQKEVGGMMLLNMGAAYPNQVLTIVLKGNALEGYKKLACDEVGAIGKVVIYKGRPEIIVSDTNDLICKSIVY
ncbi:MAG: S1/P1 nuclease [Bacteroidota bacterium]